MKELRPAILALEKRINDIADERRALRERSRPRSTSACWRGTMPRQPANGEQLTRKIRLLDGNWGSVLSSEFRGLPIICAIHHSGACES